MCKWIGNRVMQRPGGRIFKRSEKEQKMGAFIEADIEKLEKFVSQSAEAINEFQNIKTTFDQINSRLLTKWKGKGADAYKYETDHILEKIGSFKDVLDTINNDVLKSIIDAYNDLDKQLAEFNPDPDKYQKEHGGE